MRIRDEANAEHTENFLLTSQGLMMRTARLARRGVRQCLFLTMAAILGGLSET